MAYELHLAGSSHFFIPLLQRSLSLRVSVAWSKRELHLYIKSYHDILEVLHHSVWTNMSLCHFSIRAFHVDILSLRSSQLLLNSRTETFAFEDEYRWVLFLATQSQPLHQSCAPVGLTAEWVNMQSAPPGHYSIAKVCGCVYVYNIKYLNNRAMGLKVLVQWIYQARKGIAT